jgi:hypothetical protein
MFLDNETVRGTRDIRHIISLPGFIKWFTSFSFIFILIESLKNYSK